MKMKLLTKVKVDTEKSFILNGMETHFVIKDQCVKNSSMINTFIFIACLSIWGLNLNILYTGTQHQKAGNSNQYYQICCKMKIKYRDSYSLGIKIIHGKGNLTLKSFKI